MHWFPDSRELDWHWIEQPFPRENLVKIIVRVDPVDMDWLLDNGWVVYAGWRDDPLYPTHPSNDKDERNHHIFPIEQAIKLIKGVRVYGTNFQLMVWRQMIQIPRGERESYSGLATRCGKPTAVRAVAGACAKNKLLGFIPCHRIIGKNGFLTGFRGGIYWKEKWLDFE